MQHIIELLSDFFGFVGQYTDQISLPLVVIELIVAFAFCFLGYRLVRVVVALIGFGAGAAAGVMISNRFFDNEVITLLIAVIAGFFIAMLAVYIYSMGVFLVCFFCGAAIAAPFARQFLTDQMVTWIVIGVAGLVFAVLGTIFLKPLIIVMTSGFGGFKGGQLLSTLIPFSAPWFIPALCVGLAALGILIQFLTTKHYKVTRSGDSVSRY